MIANSDDPTVAASMRFCLPRSGLAIAARSSTSAKLGGDIVITYKDDVSTLDPAIGYDWQNWSIIKSLFDGLMDYKPGTTELGPTWPRATTSPTTARPSPSSCARA
jgi:ABC-type oligopeptide transport system substrate-binding subunit